MSDQKQNKAKSNNPRKVLAQIAAEQAAKKADVSNASADAGSVAADNASVSVGAAVAAGVADAASLAAEPNEANAKAGLDAIGSANLDGALGDSGASGAPAKGSAAQVRVQPQVKARPQVQPNAPKVPLAGAKPLDASRASKGASADKPAKRVTDRKIKPANEARRKKQQRRRRIAIARNTTLVLLIAFIIVFVSGLWAFRWALHDDVSDFKGKWQISGTSTVVEITDDSISLTDDVSYGYSVNDDDKTLSFEFGALSGSARYRFSMDRNELAVEDGDYDWLSTLLDDIPWLVDAVLGSFSGNASKGPAFEDGLVLERVR